MITAFSLPSIQGYFITRFNPANSNSPNAPLLVQSKSILIADSGSTIALTLRLCMVLETSESGVCPQDFVSTLVLLGADPPNCPPCTYQEFVGDFSLENGTGDLAGLRAHGENSTKVCREDLPPFNHHVHGVDTGRAFSVGD